MAVHGESGAQQELVDFDERNEMLQVWLHTFAADDKVHIALLLVLADFIFGVAAAVKANSFRLSFVADLLRKDILGKLLPYFGLYAMALVAGNIDVVIPGLDFGVLAGAAYALLVAALVGSILSSVRTLGVETLPPAVAAPESAPQP